MNTLNIVITAAGGLGIFLLGLVIMTGALRALAGEAIHAALMRFTHSPTSGAITGAVSTAILQSSSATTVAAIGFVGAGLLSFSQALGIIFGANVGTTVTGWLVTLVGFKLKLTTVLLPMVLMGVLIHLFAKGRWRHLGLAIAGFGLIFVGISMLQEGMRGLETGVIDYHLPDDNILGKLQLVGIGILFTIITQSSSAGVATTLTALYAGTINFHQAAALVIGMDIGTTFTAALATVGGSVATRRTGLSHVFYNLMTGLGAFLFITPYVWVWETYAPGALLQNSELALVAFHTSFNTLGVILVLPFARAFANMMERLIPEQRIALTRGLDASLLKEPGVAITATHSVLRQESTALIRYLKWMLEEEFQDRPFRMAELEQALQETQVYIDDIHLSQDKGRDWERLYAITHALDHMHRLHNRFRDEERRAIAKNSEHMMELKQLLDSRLIDLVNEIEAGDWGLASQRAEEMARDMDLEADGLRDRIMAMVASDEMDVPLANDSLKTLRWLNRIGTHIARMLYYLHQASETREQVQTKLQAETVA
ncbi:MAG: Na/Pi cotransporter family protein [Gammaproteobacteria bacterium]|nr:Na/Pi cotransporter family protein [Gammaproteobacteria bacterium]